METVYEEGHVTTEKIEATLQCIYNGLSEDEELYENVLFFSTP